MKQSNQLNSILKWFLLFVVIGCFIAFIWGTKNTYDEAPPIPTEIVSTNNQVVMTSNDIILGKAGFQQADLMDYGSLFGMVHLLESIIRQHTYIN
jgi:nitric oxide reductase subunit B